MAYCYIECSCGKRVYAKTALTPNVKEDLQHRIWQHIESTENHDPLTWEKILELPIDGCESKAPPGFAAPRTPSVQSVEDIIATAGNLAADDLDRLENIETAVDRVSRGFTHLVEDIQRIRRLRSRSR